MSRGPLRAVPQERVRVALPRPLYERLQAYAVGQDVSVPVAARWLLTEALKGNEPAVSDEEMDRIWGPRSGNCRCHIEGGSHELCCGHEGGRNPDCPIHGDGSP